MSNTNYPNKLIFILNFFLTLYNLEKNMSGLLDSITGTLG